MAAPVIQFKRGQFANLPGLRPGEPGFTTDKYDLYVGIDSTTSNNKFFGSHRYWTKETATAGSGLRLVEGTNNGENYIELKAPASVASNLTYTFPASITAGGYLLVDSNGDLSWDDTLDATSVNATGVGTVAFLQSTTVNVSAGATIAGALDVDGGADFSGNGITVTEVNASGVVTATTFDGNLATTNLTGTITNAQLAGSISNDKLAGSISNDKLANSSVSLGGVSVSLGGADATPAFNLADATNLPTTSLTGTITNAQLAGSITNDKLDSPSASVGGVTITLGATDATPAFDLQDATNLPTTSLTGTITNAQLAGSIADSKLNTISTANKVDLGALDIDGGTATTEVADADLMIVDDGANGTNRKVTAANLKDYMLGGGAGANFAAINVSGISTVTFADATTLKVGAGATIGGALDVDGGADISGSLTVDSGTFHVDSTNNRVGVGTSSLYQPFEVNFTDHATSFGGTGNGGDWGAGSRGMMVENQSASNGAKALVQYRVGDADYFAGIKRVGSNAASFIFQSENNAPDLTIDSSGRVAVGTNSPGCQTGGIHAVHDATQGTPSFTGAEVGIFQRNFNGAQDCAVSIVSGTNASSIINFGDKDDVNPGIIEYLNGSNAMRFSTNAAERLSITSTGGFHFTNAELIERVKITAGKLSDNTNIDLDNGMVHYFTTTETSAAVPNITSSVGINTSMATGDTMSVTIVTTAAAAAFAGTFAIDHKQVGVTTFFSGGTAPTAGGASGKDVTALTIVKTGDAAFDVLASVSNFA